jgi:hypothetical protein
MSATKFVTSSLSIAAATQGPVNLVKLSTFEKFNHAQTPEHLGRYQIHFMASDIGNAIRDIFWKYKSECDRDAEFKKLLDLQTITL